MKLKLAFLFFLLPLLTIAQSGVGLLFEQPKTRTRIIRIDTMQGVNSLRYFYKTDTVRTFPLQFSYFKILPSQKSMFEFTLQLQDNKDKNNTFTFDGPFTETNGRTSISLTAFYRYRILQVAKKKLNFWMSLAVQGTYSRQYKEQSNQIEGDVSIGKGVVLKMQPMIMYQLSKRFLIDFRWNPNFGFILGRLTLGVISTPTNFLKLHQDDSSGPQSIDYTYFYHDMRNPTFDIGIKYILK